MPSFHDVIHKEFMWELFKSGSLCDVMERVTKMLNFLCLPLTFDHLGEIEELKPGMEN